MNILDCVWRAIALRSPFPKAHSLELLDLVFEGRSLSDAECSVLSDLGAVDPQTLAFIASAFDLGMTEQEWRDWQEPTADPRLRAALQSLWIESIVPTFVGRYSGIERPALRQQSNLRHRSIRTL